VSSRQTSLSLDRFAAPLESSPRLRPILIGIAALSAVVGLGVVIQIAQPAWALDIDRDVGASKDLLAGRFGVDRGYLYSPFAAILTVPLTFLPLTTAAVTWLLLKLAVLAWGVRHETRDLGRFDAALVTLAVLAFVPTSYDLLLGNVSVLVVAAVALVAWRRDGFLTGIALGIVLATAPKPQLIPILIWMLLFRRKALTGAAVTAIVATVLTALVVGIPAYLAWIDILRAPDYLSSPMNGNLTPDALIPSLAIPIKVVGVAGFLYSLRRGETNALVAAITVGLLIAPYTLAYAAMALLLAVRPLALAAPIAAVILSAIGSIAVIVLLPAYALAWLATAVVVGMQPSMARLR
jgi:hypothetical protein